MKFVLSLTLALSIITGSLAPRTSHASGGLGLAIGGLGGANIALASGLAFLGAAAGTALVGTVTQDKTASSVYIAAMVLLGIGIILLDKEAGNELEFASLTSEKAAELGLTKSHVKDFNRVRTFVNQIGNKIGKECALKHLVKDGKATESEIHEINQCVEQGWSDYKASNSKILTKEVVETIEALRNQI